MRHWLKNNRGFIAFLLCFGFFRLAIADWNPIPSGSMRPTLLEGDVVLVDRLAYDFKLPLTDVSLRAMGEPQRGDVVVFHSPRDGTRLIKRLVALPGDTIEMRGERLIINGTAAEYDHVAKGTEPLGGDQSTEAMRATERVAGSARRVQFLQGGGAMSDFGPLTVPAGEFFFLGDNRDNSADSRYFGSVPRALLVGRAHHLLASADILGDWLPRWSRFGSAIR